MAKDKARKDKKSKDKADKKHSRTVEESAPAPDAEEDHATSDEGNFSFGYCKGCKWRGRARRSRDKARRDAKEHAAECEEHGHVKLKRTDHKD